MPYRPRSCDECGREWKPLSRADDTVCRGCRWKKNKQLQDGQQTPLHLRTCDVCAKEFTAVVDRQTGLIPVRCHACRRLAETARGVDDPRQPEHYLAPPLKQCVFDLETFSLDRGWGVLMVGTLLMFGEGPEPTWYEFDLTQSKGWPDKRSDDRELAEKVLSVLRRAHVAIGHNSARYDIPWLNSIALKYDLDPIQIKLIDPVLIARRKYRIGNNSLSAMSSFLELPEDKMHISPDVWRHALMDNDKQCWDTLRERCKSDVRLLAMLAARVTRDVGLVDYQGSAFR